LVKLKRHNQPGTGRQALQVKHMPELPFGLAQLGAVALFTLEGKNAVNFGAKVTPWAGRRFRKCR
jgi:hypothetical protein